MHQDGRAGYVAQFLEAADVIYVRVGVQNCADFQFVARDDFEDALDLIAGINHDGVVRNWIADDVAIALQHSDGQDFVD